MFDDADNLQESALIGEHHSGCFAIPLNRSRTRSLNVIFNAAEVEFATFGYQGATMKGIAGRANLSRPTIHYYFKNKRDLYRAVLERIIHLWNEPWQGISKKDDPSVALERYIRNKIMLSKSHPLASKIFAIEIIHGAPHLKNYLATEHRDWTLDKAAIIQSWADQGKMDRVDPLKLIFLIWGATQHLADFSAQISSVLNTEKYDDYFDGAAKDIVEVILKGCGLRGSC